MTSCKCQCRSLVIVFDQGVGQLRQADHELHGVDLWPVTQQTLKYLQKEKVHVTIIVQAELCKHDVQLLQNWLGDTDIILSDPLKPGTLLSKLKKLAGAQTLFVAADRYLRGEAAKLGFICTPHIAAAALLARGETLRFTRISGAPETIKRLEDLLPYGFTQRTKKVWKLFGLLTDRTIAIAVNRGLAVQCLTLDVSTEDALFVQLDDRGKKNTDKLAGCKILFADGQRVLLAIGPKEQVHSLGLYGAHGSYELLGLRPELLYTVPDEKTVSHRIELAFANWPREKLEKLEIFPVEVLKPRWPCVAWCPATAESFQSDVDRFTGVASVDTSGPIVSRHILHPDNERTVDAIAKELRDIGYCVSTPSFSHAGRTLRNVVADLPGTGVYTLDPDILEWLRELLLRHPLPFPPDPWLRELKELIGTDWIDKTRLKNLSAVELRWYIEELFELKPWKYWWGRLCKMAGIGSQIVIVGSHLDSSASYDGATYNPATDPAPGADDNASGIAGTLALARWLWNYRNCLRHTVRFCFFNAEEEGLVGSKAYASTMKSLGAPIKAVLTMDMLGYNSDAERIFEVHAGYTDSAVRDLSVPVAQVVESWAAANGVLAPAQIYQGLSWPGSGDTDRMLYDGAINRSDHASFHEQGYPAIVVSEDFFTNLPSEPVADPNPHYHRSTDTVIDASYASDITCAIAHAVKELAS